MSSYIKLVFNYLFRSSDYLADQTLGAGGSSAAGVAAGQQLHLAQMVSVQPQHRQQQQQQHIQPDSWCFALTRLLALDNRTLASSTLRTFGDFEALLRQQHLNSTWLKASSLPLSSNNVNLSSATATTTAAETWQPSQQALTAAAAAASTTTTNTAAQLLSNNEDSNKQAYYLNQMEALECFNQLQLRDYYQSYDILVGLRIASSLTILFIVFILFVIYKTGCRDNGNRPSRSQLQLSRGTTTTAGSGSASGLGGGAGGATHLSVNESSNCNTNYTSGHINQLA